MGIIIAVINNKGGTGKTTTSVNMAVALSRLQRKVLVADMDTQANATGLLMDDTSDRYDQTMYDLLGESDVRGCIYPTTYENLWLLPNISDTAMRGPEIVMAGRQGLFRVREKLREFAITRFDYTLLDCPPNLEGFVISALITSDFVLVPTQAGSKFSVQGLLKAKNFIDDIRDNYNPDIRFLKLLITMYDARTSICKNIEQSIRSNFLTSEVFSIAIPDNTDFQKAESHSQSIFRERSNASGAIAYMKAAKELIVTVEGVQLENL